MQQVAGVLIIQSGVYVAQRRDTFPTIAEPGKLSLWGGTIEGNETPAEAAVRELKEETGVVVSVDDIKHLVSFETTGRTPKNKGMPVMVHIFATELSPDVTVNCYEGQGLERITHPNEPDATDFLVMAVNLYEKGTI